MVSEGTVYVVDDDPAVRDSVKWLVESVGLRVQTFASAREFLAAYRDQGPGCLVLDLRMPGISGIETQEMLHEHGVSLPVIIVTGHGDVPVAVRAMKLGAVDFLEKPCNDHQLLERIQRSVELHAHQRGEHAERERMSRVVATLSPRERSVMELIVAGKSNKEVAIALGVSPKTVESHRANVMRKIGVGSLAELVQVAVAATPAEKPR